VIEHPANSRHGMGVPLVACGISGQVHACFHAEVVVAAGEVFNGDAFGLGELFDCGINDVHCGDQYR